MNHNRNDMKKTPILITMLSLVLATILFPWVTSAQSLKENPELDQKVEDFLASGRW